MDQAESSTANPAGRQSILEMRNVSKTYGSARALNGVSLNVRENEIHSLTGENGAGKSTLMKILAGAVAPDPGSEIWAFGRQVTIHRPQDAATLGISIIYQELSLSPNLSVAENIYLGRELSHAHIVNRSKMILGARTVLNRLGSSINASSPVSSLSIAERQLVEIARAVHVNSRILIMDEPTTALSERETERLFALMRQLRQEGLAIIYISHRMNEVYQLSDRVSVLRDGEYVGTLDRDQINPDTIVRMMVGRELSTFYKKAHATPRESEPIIFSAREMSDGKRVKGCSFDVHRGEVLGLAGLVGAGRTELARLIYGADHRISGTVEVHGQKKEIQSPKDAIRAGILYLTEDRKRLGLFPEMSVSENINVGVIQQDARIAGFLNRGTARRRSAQSVKSLSIRTPSINAAVGALSGGNQQKALLARLLELQPRVLFLDEPTRGIDIGAKSDIYRVIDKMAKENIAVVVISSELPELVGICDRVLVMREGTIAGEVGNAPGMIPLTQENIIAFATAAFSHVV
ncbi:MAG: ribose transport system ATP-binding protein [Verrucomicrobiota bacterium]|jgi:ribose transport system ATP-binding protein|nr:ribose transport system ATP-binding protein [Verrucomicrobiota bacterium]